MPTDLLPTANFAGRPTSDISMLDGLWTMIISSSSSSDDEEDVPTAPQRSPSKPTEEILSQPESDGEPRLATTDPNSDDSRPRLLSLRDDVKMLERPRLRKKANTTPPGAIFPTEFAPAQPRRALSTRLGYSGTMKGRRPQSSHLGSHNGTSIVADKAELEVSQAQETLPDIRKQTGEDNIVLKRPPQVPSSFSQKARVMETLKQKHMGMLSTTTDMGPRKGPSSANSMQMTPRELYAIPEKHSIEHIATSPRNRAPSSSASTSPGIPPISHRRKSTGHMPQVLSDARLDGSSRSQRIYLPGEICLEEHLMLPRRDSVATLDPFDESVRRANRFSDMVVQEGIIMYFEEMGVLAEATEMTLDQYWMESGARTNKRVISRRSSVSSVTETMSTSPRYLRSLRSSKFSFSSASSTASSSGTKKRPRHRLGKLWSPGSAFLRNPAAWGQQIKKL